MLLGELLAAVSAATDFAKGLPEEQALRTCRAAAILAARAGLSEDDRRAVFYVSLLRFVGCTATAPELAAALGDEIAVSALFAAVDPRDLREVIAAAAGVYADSPAVRRMLDVARFLAAAPAVIREHEVASCEVARMFAERIGLPVPVQEALGQVFERWDGRGHPGVASGDQVAVAVRVEQVAHAAELLVRTAGPDAARAGLRRRAGSSFDPALVELACADLAGLLVGPDDPLDQSEVLAAEPSPPLELTGDAVDRAVAAIGAVADLKSAYTRGHSAGVAARAVRAGQAAGLPPDEVAVLRRAGFLHDLGRVAVAASTWDRDGPLSASQWEQVRLYPYVTERVLGRCSALAAEAALAGAHHERADGSGYHRGARELSRPAALLAAADVCQALSEPRAYRPALGAAERARVLREEVSAGRLPGWAVDAVLDTGAAGAVTGAAGRPDAAGGLAGAAGRPGAAGGLAGAAGRPGAAGGLAGAAGRPGAADASGELTVRELEVLALVARGATNRACAQALSISAKTVNAHLEHIFTKLGVTTRGAAAFYAVDRGLLFPEMR